MRWHGLPAEQIVQRDITDLIDTRFARQQFVNSGHGAHVHLQSHQGIDDFTPPLRRGGGYRQQHLGNVVLLNEEIEVFRPRHAQPVNHGTLTLRVVIHEQYRMVLVAMMQCLQQLPAGSSRAVNNDLL